MVHHGWRHVYAVIVTLQVGFEMWAYRTGSRPSRLWSRNQARMTRRRRLDVIDRGQGANFPQLHRRPCPYNSPRCLTGNLHIARGIILA